MEEHALSNEIIENVVTFLQYVAHPLFNMTAVCIIILLLFCTLLSTLFNCIIL